MGVVHAVARRAAGTSRPGEPDRVSGDVVSGLMAELRKAQAEAAYWKSAAERLQREADERERLSGGSMGAPNRR